MNDLRTRLRTAIRLGLWLVVQDEVGATGGQKANLTGDVLVSNNGSMR